MPSDAWLTAFEKQAPAAMADAARFAGRRAAALIRVGGLAVADDLVADALGDTFAGVLAWDPARVSLTQHVRSAIAVRVTHAIARQGRLQHLPMVGDLDSGDGLDLVAADASRRVAAEDEGPPERIAMRTSASSAVAALRRMAEDDEDVLALLDAYRAECFSRADVIDVTGMSVRDYDNARRRLTALAAQLPPGIRIGGRLRYA